MNDQLFQITWEIHSGLNEFYSREYKVFKTHEEASEYCDFKEKEWNFGLTYDEMAWKEGYYYKFLSPYLIAEIDGRKIHLSMIEE